MKFLKGLEDEVYGGKPDGTIVPLSHLVKKHLPDIHTEPDARNIEMVTPPIVNYKELGDDICEKRARLRHCLSELGDYTLVPGSSMSLGDTSVFHRSTPENNYHGWIEDTYGTDVVTTSVHINLGIPDMDDMFRVCRVIRMEAGLFLALTACSPFLDGKATGFHSTRWATFPRTPKIVPLFESHAHYIEWIHEQIKGGTMQNIRHLWDSIRPNGKQAPEKLNRLELRICDRMDDPAMLVAVTALYETRALQVIEGDDDPLAVDWVSDSERPETMQRIAVENEVAAARDSLAATLTCWRTGKKIAAKEWLTEFVANAQAYALRHEYDCALTPLDAVLANGNPAQRWLREHKAGRSISDILRDAATRMHAAERAFLEPSESRERFHCLQA